ncbi:metallophosphoesterase [Rhizobium mongolense]|uniref:Phosphohydrolase n=2 Tax=Rhizobium mongolense TaxID=57676 RepID=A0ABR6IW82_9HYPH|nr:metallophosphoesterase [Rhizobium mongolense]MBB4232172.1 putative phosphohydrolase [Rhizobium mongolense]TVZ63107.1 calcineurin-like phosphoesterase family protein [Rhizobium mongolense USDA 1844]
MKAWIVSDIHSSPMDFFLTRRLDVPEADICLCAGDIANNIERSIDFLFAEIAPHMSVVVTLGNHDCYGSSIARALEYARKWTAGTNVHVLENEEFRKDDLRIIGATLWTEFEITAHDAGHLPVDVRRDLAISECRRALVDFREIYRSDERRDGEGGYISAREMISRHKDSRAYIEAALRNRSRGQLWFSLIMRRPRGHLTHGLLGHISNAAFASDLSTMIQAKKPTFWIHGHVHCFQDYVEGETRVLCNPRGYRNERPGGGFQPGFVIETSSSAR